MPIARINDSGALEVYGTDLDTWDRNFARFLINGPPLSGKTTAAATFPRPLHMLVAPGELGHSSVMESKDLHVYQFEFDPADELRFNDTWKGVQELVGNILSGQFGKVETFVIDGLHKLYYLIQKAFNYRIGTDAREYAKYHEAFRNFIQPIVASPIPYVVATCYDGMENADDPKQKMTIYPALPGMMAKEVMGVFPVVFHSSRVRVGNDEQFFWQLRATEKVQGAGMHVPPAIRDCFPDEIEPSWPALKKLLDEAKKQNGTSSKKTNAVATKASATAKGRK